MDDHYNQYPQSSAPPNTPYSDSRSIRHPSTQSSSSQPQPQYAYSNHPPSQPSYGWQNPMTSWSQPLSLIPTPQSMSMPPMTGLVSPATSNIMGMGAPSTPSRPKLTTTLWEDEGTLCYQVDAKGVCVARRQDNDMINGTKLLNVVGMSRGKRDGILKNEKGRVVVKVGAMHLKGVWITFQRAKALATQFKILDLLYPVFVDDPSIYLYTSPGVSSSPSARLPAPAYGTTGSTYRSHASFNSHWDPRNPAQHSQSSRHPAIGAQSDEDMYLVSPFNYPVQQGAPTMSSQNVGVIRPRNPFSTSVSISPASSPSPSIDRPTMPQPSQSDYQSLHAYSASSDSESDSTRRVMQMPPGRVPSPRHHPYGGSSYSSQPLQRL